MHLVPHKNNAKVTNIKDTIANTLTETFSTHSSSQNANKQCVNIKDIIEKHFRSENTGSYNGFFTLPEVE